MSRAIASENFLADLDGRSVQLSGTTLRDPRLFLGHGDTPLEVVVGSTAGRLSAAELRTLWTQRRGGRAAPVILVAISSDGCSVVAPVGNEPHVELVVPVAQAERLVRAALGLPNRNQVFRFLAASLPEIGSPTPGVRNEGLFATHELRVGVQGRPDWASTGTKAKRLLAARDKTLMAGLGFEIRPLRGPASMLVTQGGAQAAVAVFLGEHEEPDLVSERFNQQSPVTYALAQADQAEVAWVVVNTGASLRLYSTRPGAGVGARGRSETFAEIRLDLLREDQAAYLWLLFSADALRAAGTAGQILESSRDYATELGSRLRKRVYEEVMPALAHALLRAQRLEDPTAEQLQSTYRLALLTLFRLLFIAYAEDRDLLPYRTNEAYRRRALKTKAREVADAAVPSDAVPSVLWPELVMLFRAIDKSRAEWGIPAYNGGLFSEDASVSETGALLATLTLPDVDVVPALRALLTDQGADGKGPIDFRSLGVRDFGTVYEGLLENELNVAPEDLVVDKQGNYRPPRGKEIPIVRKGEVYLTNSSGARKETGSYFTKQFVVDHLLDQALEPALEDHVARLMGMSEHDAAAAFFDFKVADLAMGSGHFLVAAIDRIERRLADVLVRRPLPEVRDELARLRQRAEESLGPVGRGREVAIEDSQLLRRQIARRCIYGVDLNPDAVDLARLSIWVHTFIPGLPLSVLDHHLVEGNSLVGIGSPDEAEDLLRARGQMFPQYAKRWLEEGAEAAAKLGRLDEADAAEVKQARKALEEARKAVRPAVALFDVLTAVRIAEKAGESVFWDAVALLEKKPKALWQSPTHEAALGLLAPLAPFHLPLAFPDVFTRARPGFDAILGNPPWEEAQVEEDRFWCRYEPGLQSLPQGEQETRKKKLRKKHPDRVERFEVEKGRAEAYRRALVAGGFAGMGTGDPDTYKAFTWRFWQAVAKDGGIVGVVLPVAVFNAKGSTEWRRQILATGRFRDLTFLTNNKSWVFDDVHPQYTVALAVFSPEPPAPSYVVEPGLFGDVVTRKSKKKAAKKRSSHTYAVAADESRAAEDAGPAHIIPLRGPYADMARYRRGLKGPPCNVALDAILDGTDTAAFPMLPTEESMNVWAQMRKAPRVDLDDGKSWRARPYAELHATNDKPLMKFTEHPPDGWWPVYKGESFDIWKCDTGTYYAWVDPEKIQKTLLEKRLAARGKDSPFSEFSEQWRQDPKTLPCHTPRIAFRDVSRATDSRTVRAALLPSSLVVANQAPFLLWPRGDERDQAFLLGVLCSLPLDWYARRFVDKHLNYHVFNPLPVPRPLRDHAGWKRAVALAGRLAAHDKRLRKWAKKVGVECGPLPEDEKADMIAELDAVVAHLYGLTEPQLAHVFETFHEGWDYGERLEAVRAHFQVLGKKAR